MLSRSLQKTILALLLCLLSNVPGTAMSGTDVVFRLPTANNALFAQKYDDFYMYVDRNFEGVKSKPWQGGSYGFTRTLVRTSSGPVAVKFHEGIDIKPLKRNAAGVPLDKVHPCAPGRVVHVCSNPSDSSYGRYVVIEHQLADGPLYSLYAHLGSTSCQPGQRVGTGNVIGTLGYSGVGLNKVRAHLHFELCMLINKDFQKWYDSKNYALPNKHGVYHGFNLIGMDPAEVLCACENGEPFSLATYVSKQPWQYRVRIPAEGQLDIAGRYPFLVKEGVANPASWEIEFAGSGLPLSITPSDTPCTKPIVFAAVPHPFIQKYRTVNRVDGSSKKPVLTSSGHDYIRIYTTKP